MTSPRTKYQECLDTSPEAELSALVAVYKFVLFGSQERTGGQHDLTNDSIAEMEKNGPQNTESEKIKMTKLTARGYEILDSGRYVLEVVEAESVNEYGPQLKLRLRVAEGEHEGFEFVDYPNRGTEDGVKVGTKAWDIFEGCLNQRLSPDKELDTDDLVGKRFEAMVSIKKTGKGNRTEHGTIGPHRPKKARLDEVPQAEQPDDIGDEEFEKIPL